MRDISIDITRGLAIFTMIAANMLPFLLTPPVSLPIRLYGTFAAPAFVMIAGMMVALTGKKHSLRYYIDRGGVVVLIGILIDVFLYHLYPFKSADVLYLIGLSLPLAYLFLGLDKGARWAIICLIFLLTPVLQASLGYREANLADTGLTGIARSFVIDGFFPVFPWLGFSLLGAQLGTLRWQNGTINRFNVPRWAAPTALLLAAGLILWAAFPGAMYVRYGYAELFYPATAGFIATAIGITLLAIAAFDALGDRRFLWPLRTMGEYSMHIYVAHTVIILLVIRALNVRVSLPVFILAYLALAFAMCLLAVGLKKRGPFDVRLKQDTA